MSESDLKHQVKDFLTLWGIYNYHNLQGIGAKKGIPDRIMHYQGKVHYLEIKLPKGKMSAWQLAFQEQCKADGIGYHIIRSLEDLIEVLKTE